jgi:hypothetical protein
LEAAVRCFLTGFWLVCWLACAGIPVFAEVQTGAVDPNQLVLLAVERAVWGPSLSCRIQQTSIWGDHQVIAEGKYCHTGGGAGQLKMEMQLDAKGQKSNFLQVSDGRLVWTNIGEGESPRRVYLDRVRESLGGWVRKPGLRPEMSLYLAIGGQAEALRCLYQRYRWFKVFAGVDDKGREVWQLVGTIRSEPPTPSAQTPVDVLLVSASLPAEVPTDVRLTLGRDEKNYLFPYKVDYYRKEKSEAGVPGKWIRVSTIEYSDIESSLEVPADYFEYRASNDADQIKDETKEYMPLNPQAFQHPPTRR